MRVILDANVVVAAFASRGLCESILELCLDSHEIILSEHLLDEISRNLIKKIKLPKEVVYNMSSGYKKYWTKRYWTAIVFVYGRGTNTGYIEYHPTDKGF